MLEGMRSLLQRCRVLDLSQPMKQGMPGFPTHVPFAFSLNIRHTDIDIPGGLGVASDVIMGTTHSGTHIDAIGHFSRNGCIHGGFDVRAVTTGHGGLSKHGIEETPPILRRAVLLDVASFKDVDALDPAYPITDGDLEKTARAEGIELRRGDVALIRTGWAKYWESPARYVGLASGSPGPDLSGAEWLVQSGASIVGNDTCSFEANDWDGRGDVHGFLLADHGVQIVENLDLEELARGRIYSFLFFALPLKIVGATASPIRPIAICG